MAVGKTSAARYACAHAPGLFLSPEDNAAVIDEIRRRGLQKTDYADYLEIQRLFLQNEVRRCALARTHPVSLMDFGAEEIEFYTLHYPKSIGMDWDVERPLAEELAAVRACMPSRILFLDASEATLRRRRDGDATRSREFFEHHLTCLMPLKRAWFLGRADVDRLDTDDMTPDEVGNAVLRWVKQHSNG